MYAQIKATLSTKTLRMRRNLNRRSSIINWFYVQIANWIYSICIIPWKQIGIQSNNRIGSSRFIFNLKECDTFFLEQNQCGINSDKNENKSDDLDFSCDLNEWDLEQSNQNSFIQKKEIQIGCAQFVTIRKQINSFSELQLGSR